MLNVNTFPEETPPFIPDNAIVIGTQHHEGDLLHVIDDKQPVDYEDDPIAWAKTVLGIEDPTKKPQLISYANTNGFKVNRRFSAKNMLADLYVQYEEARHAQQGVQETELFTLGEQGTGVNKVETEQPEPSIDLIAMDILTIRLTVSINGKKSTSVYRLAE